MPIVLLLTVIGIKLPDEDCYNDALTGNEVVNVIANNWLSFLFIILSVFSYFLCKKLEYKFKGTKDLPVDNTSQNMCEQFIELLRVDFVMDGCP